ncbi:MAG: hypothetical protein AABZ31_05950 [Bdellovibrionota bacterium]
MIQKVVRLKLIQDLSLAFLALAVAISLLPSTSQAQGKKYVKIVFEEKEKSSKKKNKVAQNKYGRQRIPASIIEAPTHGNIVQVHDYVPDVEELDTPKKSIVPKNKKPLAEDAEISRDMVIAK